MGLAGSGKQADAGWGRERSNLGEARGGGEGEIARGKEVRLGWGPLAGA